MAGVALGNLGNAVAASLGLAALFAVSSLAFAVIKYAGALYLVYLGVQMFRSAPAQDLPAMPVVESPWRVFRDGFIVALFNPKTTIFFAAFLPQFLAADAALMLQSIALGSLFVVVAAITDSIYALAAGTVAPLLRSFTMRRFAQKLGGGLFIALGIFAALMDRQGRTRL